MATNPYAHIHALGPFRTVCVIQSPRGRGVWHAIEHSSYPSCYSWGSNKKTTFERRTYALVDLDFSQMCAKCETHYAKRDRDPVSLASVEPLAGGPYPVTGGGRPLRMIKWFQAALERLADVSTTPRQGSGGTSTSQVAQIAALIEQVPDFIDDEQMSAQMRTDVASLVAELTSVAIYMAPAEQNITSVPEMEWFAAEIEVDAACSQVQDSESLRSIKLAYGEPTSVIRNIAKRILSSEDRPRRLAVEADKLTDDVTSMSNIPTGVFRRLPEPPGGYKSGETVAEAARRSWYAMLRPSVDDLLESLLERIVATAADTVEVPVAIWLREGTSIVADGDPSSALVAVMDRYRRRTVPTQHHGTPGVGVWHVLSVPRTIAVWMRHAARLRQYTLLEGGTTEPWPNGHTFSYQEVGLDPPRYGRWFDSHIVRFARDWTVERVEVFLSLIGNDVDPDTAAVASGGLV